MKIVVLLLVCLALVQSQSLNSCPFSEDIRPCVCSIGTDQKPWVTCENVKSANQLVKAVKNMKGLSVSTFNLEKSYIGVLPADVFNGLEIESLNILNANLTKLSEDRSRPPFLGLENCLQFLEIRESFVNNTPLSVLPLSHLKKLTLIQLEDNFVPTIANNWFESGPYGLRDLHFLNLNTSKLGSHAFEALERLEYFVLSNSFLTEITRDMFPTSALYLKSIDLSENKLKSLPDNMFSKMPALEQVFFENNLFTTISEVTFSQIWSQLEYVYFHGNPIICDKGLSWIYKYRLPEHYGGYCASPARLLDKEFKNITLSDLM